MYGECGTALMKNDEILVIVTVHISKGNIPEYGRSVRVHRFVHLKLDWVSIPDLPSEPKGQKKGDQTDHHQQHHLVVLHFSLLPVDSF